MTVNGQHTHVPAYMAQGAALGSRAIAMALAGDRPGLPGDKDQKQAAASFIGYVMFTVQMGNGLHPSTAVDFITADGRGCDLARGVLTTGAAAVCCDYCGELLGEAIVAAAAAQMRAIHGEDQAPVQWNALWAAIAGSPYVG